MSKQQQIDPKQLRLMVYIFAPLSAAIIIGILVALPVWVANTALTKEAQDKGIEVKHAVDFDLIK